MNWPAPLVTANFDTVTCSPAQIKELQIEALSNCGFPAAPALRLVVVYASKLGGNLGGKLGGNLGGKLGGKHLYQPVRRVRSLACPGKLRDVVKNRKAG